MHGGETGRRRLRRGGGRWGGLVAEEGRENAWESGVQARMKRTLEECDGREELMLGKGRD